MPDIKVKNIYYMLSYAFQALREAGFDNVASEDFDSIHDLFAAILARGVGMQVKRGLYRDYVQREEALAGLRGQVEVAETLNLPRLKSRDSCFIDRCHCWSYTVSTGVTSGSSCRTD